MELLSAISIGNKEHVKELISSNRVDVKEVDQYGNTGLHLAKDPEIVSCLLNASCDFNAKNFDGDTALNSWYKLNMNSPSMVFNFNACKDKILALIEAGADCNIPNKLGQTVLHTLLVYGGEGALSLTEEQLNDLLTLVITLGHADVHMADYEKCIPLHYAIAESATIIEVLLQSGSDVNFQNIWGGTALHLLSCNGDSESIATLLNYGANPWIQDRDGKTCLHHAASMGNESSISIIIDYYLRQSNRNNVQENSDSLSLIDIKDLNGQTAIHLSSINKKIEATALMIAYNADMNATDNFGATCLHYGAVGGTIEIVEMLVNAGADPAKLDCNGMTAKELAYERHYFETALAIERTSNYDSKLHPADNIFNTYIHKSRLLMNPFDLQHIDKMLMEEMSKEFQGDFGKYLHEMTYVLGIGRIPCTEEVAQIQVAIENFIEKLALTIAEIDDRFQGNILKCGSWYEGTKVGEPNEFDFMLCLSEIENLCSAKIREDQIDGITVFKKDSSLRSKKFDLFFREDELQSGDLMEHFVLVARRALSRLKYESNCCNLQVQGITEHSLVDATWLLPGTVTCELKFTWTGPRYKQLIITTDLVPAIYIDHLPKSSSFTSIAQELDETGCHIVSKSGSWRLSFSLAEKTIFERLHTKNKEAYIHAKIALHPAVSGRFFLINPDDNPDSPKYWIDDWDLSETEKDHTSDILYDVGNEINRKKENEDVVNIFRGTFKKPGGEFFNIPQAMGEDSLTLDDDVEVSVLSEVEDAVKEYEEKQMVRRITLDSGIESCDNIENPVAYKAAAGFETEKDSVAMESLVAASGNTMSRGRLFAKVLCNTRLNSNEAVGVLSFEDCLKENEAEKLRIISSINESREVNVEYKLHGEESDDLECIDGRSLIPSYLLKLVMLNCVEKKGIEQIEKSKTNEINGLDSIVTTEQIFEELRRCLYKKEPVPYFFCKKQDFLKKVVKNGEIFCKISFIVSFICAQFQKTEFKTEE